MEKLEIEPTKFAPKIVFDKEAGFFSISGKSIPENPSIFYAPVFSWMKEYFKNPNKITVLEFFMDYFNTSTSKIFTELFEFIEEADNKGINVKVIWYYEPGDDELKEIGEELLEQVSLPFSLIKKNRL